MDHVNDPMRMSAVLFPQRHGAALGVASGGESPAAPPRSFAAEFPGESPGERAPEHLATRLDSREHFVDDVPEHDMSWGDLIDVINPLQHIPVVSSLYRAVTGDEISGSARVMGATLYGGPIGLIAGATNAIMAEVNGAGLGDTLVAGLLGEEVPGTAPEGGTLLAEAEAAPEATSDAAPDLAPAAEPVDQAPEPAAQLDNTTTGLASAFGQGLETPGQVLTGDAALSALMGDLRTASSGPPSDGAKPAPTLSVTSEPLPSPPAHTGILPAQAPGAVPQQAFAKQMMLGLDKYQSMAIERGGAGRPEPKPLDQSF